jgi:prevent-host-death family protein
MATKSVGVRELKDQAPKFVQRAERGERFVITRHGKPAALLGPAELTPKSRVGSRLQEWERERLAFERLVPKLPRRLQGRFVAVSGGAMVDSDSDASALFERVARRLNGRTFFIGRSGGVEPVVDMPGFELE